MRYGKNGARKASGDIAMDGLLELNLLIAGERSHSHRAMSGNTALFEVALMIFLSGIKI